ncbi:BlaI/MecI/CopY family transcriptional regulator [Singulisphaera sp. PoT]|uniref:BlaI/MecI/CopY family transcriptional regulator n=1 Tax=Singulisphaera sp. PoT TaxID=3411797 RepID=UPI003BF5AE42
MPRPAPLKFLSEAQMEILDVVWEFGEATVADVLRVLSARRKLSRTTVLTMLTRLEEKGWLDRREEGRAFYYRATLPKDPTLGGMVRRLEDTVFGGSLEAFVAALLQGRRVSREEARTIVKLVELATVKPPKTSTRVAKVGSTRRA